MIELDQLQRFILLVDARSFTVAAARLGISQPALSQSIARLERDLGCVLIARNKQRPGTGIEPTMAGDALYAEAADILAAASRLEARVRRIGSRGGLTSLIVGFSPGTPRALVSAALSVGDADTSVSATQLDWGHEHEALADGTADVVIHQYPQGARLPGCELFGLVRVALVALLPADHRLAGRTRLALADLGGEPILDPGLENAPPGFRDMWLGLPRPALAPLGPIVGPAHRTVDEMYAFVAAHRGMAITSESVAKESPRQDVVARVIDDLDPLEVGVVVRTDDTSPTVRAVVAGLLAATSH